MTLRHVADADATALADRLRDWSEHRSDAYPGRVWFRHFAGTSWLAASDGESRPLGLLLGFASPERAGEIVIHYLAVDPAFRRKGIGRALVTRFEDAGRDAGARRVTAACRPDDRAVLAFFAALGYAPATEPGTRRLYGVPALADFDGPGQDRAIVERAIG